MMTDTSKMSQELTEKAEKKHLHCFQQINVQEGVYQISRVKGVKVKDLRGNMSSSWNSEPGTYLEVQGIRIEPPEIFFNNPFEGRNYSVKLILTNISKNSAYIKILDPSSNSVKIKPLKSSNLFPGQQITTSIKYTASMATIVEFYIIPIYINEEWYDYKITVRSVVPDLQIDPPFIDFGVIDAGPSPTLRMAHLSNTGEKAARFSIDLGLNDLNLHIEPMKGIVMEKGNKDLHIELSILQEGTYHSEFWIICEDPVCVKISVKVVFGVIETIYQAKPSNFTFLHFTKTYFGSKQTSAVLLRSNSQNPSIFCVTGEIGTGQQVISKRLSDLPDDFKHYDGYPLNGYLHANDVRPLIFTFAPKNIPNKILNYMLIVIKIKKLYCKNLQKGETTEFFKDWERQNTQFQEVSSTFVLNIRKSDSSLEGLTDRDVDYDYEGLEAEDCIPPEQFYQSSVRIMMYGEAEEASISVEPNELSFEDSAYKEVLTRVLTITNNSYELPIIFNYVKTAYININPSKGTLKPRERVQVEVIFKCSAHCIESNAIIFDLLFWDRPRLTKDFVKVGTHKVPFTVKSVHMDNLKVNEPFAVNTFFKKPFVKPQQLIMKRLIENDAILAMNVDISSIMRPWKDEKIVMTPYTAIPRQKNPTDCYQLTPVQLQRKLFNNRFFLNYLRDMENRHKKIENLQMKKLEEDDVYEAELTCPNVLKIHKTSTPPANFLPLTPSQLNGITITPRNRIIDWVACRSNFVSKFKIRNENAVAFRIYLRPHKPNTFNFHCGNRFIIRENSEEFVEYMCITKNVGTMYWILDVVVNETHVFETTLVAQVKATSLQLSFTDATFYANEPTYKYLVLTNSMNTKIDFYWDYIGQFEIYPLQGYVPARKSITCKISYEIGVCKTMLNDLSLCVDKKKFINITLRLETPQIHFHYLDLISFGSVGYNLNSTLTLPISNRTIHKLSFAVSPIDLEGLMILPTKGVFYPKGIIFFKLELNRSKIGKFLCVININIAHGSKLLKIDVEGNIEFPAIEVSPTNIKFSKKAASSFDIKCLTLRNLSNIKAMIGFDIDKTSEIRYSEYNNSSYFKEGEYFFIQPKTSKLVTLHFYPQYAQSNSIYFPILVNNCGKKSGIKFTAHNSKLQTNVMPHKLLTSTWTYKFYFSPSSNSLCVLNHFIKFEANGGPPVVFIIRSDKIKPNFSFRHIQGGSVTIYDRAVLCKLQETEKVVFEATFMPSKAGEYNAKLPLFIRDDPNEEVHNVIILQAEYPHATVDFVDDIVYLGSIPLEFPILRVVRGTLQHHGPSCNMIVFCSDINVKHDIEILQSGTESIVSLRIIYYSSEPHILNVTLEFTCLCGCQKELLLVGGASNALLTTYASLKYFRLCTKDWKTHFSQNPSAKIKNLSLLSVHTLSSISLPDLLSNNYSNSLPFFPPRGHELHDYMGEVLLAIEQWLFHQGNCGLFYYKIPDAIAELTIVASKIETRRKQLSTVNAPIYNLLLYLCGAQLNSFFSLSFDTQNSLAQWGIEFYTKMLEMLTELDCYLPHVQPAFLLPYSLYTDLNLTRKLNRGMFHAASKQCWLDVVLQIFNVLVYNKSYRDATVAKNTSKSTVKKKLKKISANIMVDTELINQHVYSDRSSKLLSWLDTTLENFKGRFMSPEFTNKYCDEIASKRIQNFDSDLSDGLAYAAITLANCPYLLKYYKTLFVPPITEEQCYHNAYLNIKAWNALYMDLYNEPKDLVYMNPVRAVFLCDYLAVFMKTLKVIDLLTFQSNLSQTTNEELTIINENNHTIRYNAIFFDNEDETFWVDDYFIAVKPNGSYDLKIYFKAKFAKKITATLALCGEISGSKCTQSRIYTLEGIPQLKNPHNSLIVLTNIYEIKKVILKITPPYEEPAKYDIYVDQNILPNIDDLRLKPYSYYLDNSILSRIKLNQPHCTCIEEGGTLELQSTVCCISLLPEKISLFFRNREVGDFFVVITIQAKPTNTFTEFTYKLPENFKSFNCTCPTIPDCMTICPKNVTLQIPYTNELMLNSLLTYYTTKINKSVDEGQFWKAYAGTLIAKTVLGKILCSNRNYTTQGMSYIYETGVKFNVKTTTSDIIVQKTVIIGDLLNLYKTVDLRVHLNSVPTCIDLSLNSENGAEKRLYKFNFN